MAESDTIIELIQQLNMAQQATNATSYAYGVDLATIEQINIRNQETVKNTITEIKGFVTEATSLTKEERDALRTLAESHDEITSLLGQDEIKLKIRQSIENDLSQVEVELNNIPKGRFSDRRKETSEREKNELMAELNALGEITPAVSTASHLSSEGTKLYNEITNLINNNASIADHMAAISNASTEAITQLHTEIESGTLDIQGAGNIELMVKNRYNQLLQQTPEPSTAAVAPNPNSITVPAFDTSSSSSESNQAQTLQQNLGDGYLFNGVGSQELVMLLQTILNEILGLDLKLDGIFGPQTEQAVRQLQQDGGIGVDGIVGPETLAAMSSRLTAQQRAQTEVSTNTEIIPDTDVPATGAGISPTPVPYIMDTSNGPTLHGT